MLLIRPRRQCLFMVRHRITGRKRKNKFLIHTCYSHLTYFAICRLTKQDTQAVKDTLVSVAAKGAAILLQRLVATTLG